jgi:predicted TIM-barrel fold metal-dependent hydrolase
VKEIADAIAPRLGLDRRQFLRTSCGMAAAFLAMNDVFGRLFAIDRAEAAEPAAAAERTNSLAGQFIFDDQVHFVRDDYQGERILRLAKYASEHWNPDMLKDAGLTLARYKFDNFVKEIYLDSDTKIGLLSGAPFDDPALWFLINGIAGSRRLLAHSLITPGQPGWMEEVDRCIAEVKPDSWKGYTIGDPSAPPNNKYPWRLDDEKLMYPFYEKAVKAGITTICIHKGLLPKDYETSAANSWQYATVDDVPKAAKDWPQLSFVIYHAAKQAFLVPPDDELAEFEKTGYIRWVSDLAAIPQKYGVSNVYGEIGSAFANSAVANPRCAAAMMGTLIKGMGSDHVVWGTDSVWYGSPQWQIEAMRRLEIPEDMQKKYGFKPLGAADGPVKNAILGENGLRIFGYNRKAEFASPDRFATMKDEYERNGPSRSNLRYGYMAKPA